MNILSDTGYCSRFLTDWAGPDAMVQALAIRLGVPVFPGCTLTYTGSVTAPRVATVTTASSRSSSLPRTSSGSTCAAPRLSLPLAAPAASSSRA